MGRMFDDAEAYRRARDAEIVNRATIARLYNRHPAEIIVVNHDTALAIKVSFPRPQSSGQACLAKKSRSNPTGLSRRVRDHGIDIHAELLGRRARGDNPQFQARVIALEVREAGNKPAQREGRQRRYVVQPAGSRAVLHPPRYNRQTIKCRAGFGGQLRPRLGRHGVTAGAQKR
jgi:hypothetical protein